MPIVLPILLMKINCGRNRQFLAIHCDENKL
jgi:hypothetical protein